MIDFTTLQGLTIPEGVVTQITDASGRVIWAVQSESGEPIVLEVEKITHNTYAGETTYTGESFILLDIYPKTASSKVKVTYGGLTKTLIFSGTNAQQVFFGTFNGVADEVDTPANGTLTIEGGYVAFGCGVFKAAKTERNIRICNCVTVITDLGGVEYIPDNAFCGSTSDETTHCDKIHSVVIPSSVKSIGAYAFSCLDNLQQVTMLATTPPSLVPIISTDEDLGITTTSYMSFYGYVKHNLTFIVPKGCIEAYTTAEGWSSYTWNSGSSSYKIVEAS